MLFSSQQALFRGAVLEPRDAFLEPTGAVLFEAACAVLVLTGVVLDDPTGAVLEPTEAIQYSRKTFV